MKSLINLLGRSTLGIKVRNFIGYRPVILNNDYKDAGNVSISDAFPWRTDNGYKTKFKYTDILGLFYKIENSFVELVFYSQNDQLIRKIRINQLNYSNELLIDKDFLNGIEGYGVFYIFHRSDKYSSDNIAISNRCYVGFSKNNSLSSFVHGNSFVGYQGLDGKIFGKGMVLSSFFKNRYRIQNSFCDFNKSELFFSNPTPKKVNFSIGGNKYSLEKGCSILVDVGNKNNISIVSKCKFIRPIIFNYKDDFFDVYHA
jgi:hypothetical protein